MNVLKRIMCVSASLVICVSLAACGGAKVPERLIGDWQCGDTASDGSTDTSFYALTIESDGQFSLYDVEAGNPGISGKMEGDDTGKLGILNLECNEEDFDPPFCWNLGQKARLRYKIVDENTMRLGYTGIWLTFTKQP